MTTLMVKRLLPAAALLALVAIPTGVALGPTEAQANTTAPAPTPTVTACKRYKKGTRRWKKCIRDHTNSQKPDEAFYAGYWLAKTGDYKGALEMLKPAEKSGDVRVLTYIGYATRKLGDIDGGIAYYDRALEADPNYNAAREYLGEGYIQKGDLAKAEAQLAEIAARCGTSCESYSELAEVIAKYKDDRSL